MTRILIKIIETPRLYFEDALTYVLSITGLLEMDATVSRSFKQPAFLLPLAEFMDKCGFTTRALLREYNTRHPDKPLPNPYDDEQF
ncbi:MAG: hypothetical protein ACLFR0_00490 [Alphaproteobacteria bacterium]